MQSKELITRFTKRAFDIFASFLAILILFPFFVIISIIIVIDSKGSPFYLSKRIGKNKKEIKVIKFRSMRENVDSLKKTLSKEEYKEFLKNYKLDNDPRVTKFGKLLRKSSIDELPQIFNIFIGDMSFVGPRPIVVDEYHRLWKNEELIFKVRPGLTGYWGVKGRSNTTYKERIELENYYVTHFSLWLDIKIIILTIGVVLTGKGAI